MKKFAFENIANYVGVDISLGQLKDALTRKTNSQIRYPVLFIKAGGELESDLFYKSIPENMYFDLVSAQFCIHYFFENQQSVRNFLENVTRRLTKNGRFIATFPDSNVIMKKLLSQYRKDDYTVSENKHMSLMIDRENLEKEQPFGIKYGFFLDGQLVGDKYIDSNKIHIKYVPEYLIILRPFIELAKEYGLEIELSENFHQFYAQFIQDNAYFNLFKRMKFEAKGETIMDDDEWDCSYIYRSHNKGCHLSQSPGTAP